jgi:membrane AbrB-like protein
MRSPPDADSIMRVDAAAGLAAAFQRPGRERAGCIPGSAPPLRGARSAAFSCSMSTEPVPHPIALPSGLAPLSRPWRWAALVALSAAIGALLHAAWVPAALMLGPMIAGLLMEIGGGTVRVPPLAMNVAQGIIGCLIARAISLDILGTFARRWPLFLGIVALTLIASMALGWLIGRLRILPRTTAIWGMLPGAASAMILMAEAFGADFRLVAFMQYLRVALLAVTASLIARLWTHGGGAMPEAAWFPPIAWPGFAVTLAIVAAGVAVARTTKLPAGGLLSTMAIGVVVHLAAPELLELPPWFLTIGYALLGWNIGLRFTRPVLVAALRALPQTFASIVALMLFCAGVAGLLVATLGVDPLTAYLATSPGGVDSVAIIAASTPVDVAFVMALQTVRFVLILLFGPALSRFIARRLGGDTA